MKALIKNPRDFWAGVMFIVFGCLFAGVALTSYKMGTAARMGPGYFPFVLGALLVILGAIITLTSFRAKNKGPAVDKFYWRPVFWTMRCKNSVHLPGQAPKPPDSANSPTFSPVFGSTMTK